MRKIDEIYTNKKKDIQKRLEEFKEIWNERNHRKIFKEFVFCLLTPQSKAKVCWQAVEEMEKSGILWRGALDEIKNKLKGVRFKNNKASYILEAREKFWKDGHFKIINEIENLKPEEAREFLVKNVKGMGYKEASHFLRNIGFSQELAILDRHILKNLFREGVISEIPLNLSRKKYLHIERKMKEYSSTMDIPISHLDLLYWSMETGEIFK